MAKAVIDSVAIVGGIVVAGFARFDFQPAHVPWLGLFVLGIGAGACQIAAGTALGVYTGRWVFGSMEEAAAVSAAVAVTSVAATIGDLADHGERLAPRTAPLLGGVVAVVAMGAIRYVWRASLKYKGHRSGVKSTRLLIIGAGDGGSRVIRSILRDDSATYLPVALLDDDPGKRNLRLMGVRVVGDRGQIKEAARAFKADALLIAAPSASAETVEELSTLANEAELPVKVLPPISRLFGDRVGVEDIRDVQISDLLGRTPIETDLESIAGYLEGRRVLVTGAGGSIGSELCRQIAKFRPAQLMMLDRDESALHGVQLSIEGRALLDTPNVILADIRDRERIERIFSTREPEVVFHAAALKHLPLLEQAPGEAVKSNVWGTLNVLHAAMQAGVDRFVNVSTDKAADPISVLGYSKRLAERLTAHVAAETKTGTYVSVRFGNVLGSRGSVLHAFKAQALAGGPITVTHPEVTRYFMTVEEAVQLVIQAAAIGRPGEVLVLEMGQPVPIADVAKHMARTAAPPIDIVYTGLRHGEKLHEVLFGVGEVDVRPFHPLISHVGVPPIDPELTAQLDPQENCRGLMISLNGLCRSRPTKRYRTFALNPVAVGRRPTLGDDTGLG